MDHEQVLRWREAFRNTLEKQSQAHAVGSSSLSQAERGAHSRRPTGGRPHSPQCGHGDRVCLELALTGENRAKRGERERYGMTHHTVHVLLLNAA